MTWQRIFPIPFDSESFIGNHAHATLQIENHIIQFRPLQMIIEDPMRWNITSIRIGRKEQIMSSLPLSAFCLSSMAIKFDVIALGELIRISVFNRGPDSAIFRGAFAGEQIDFNSQGFTP